MWIKITISYLSGVTKPCLLMQQLINNIEKKVIYVNCESVQHSGLCISHTQLWYQGACIQIPISTLRWKTNRRNLVLVRSDHRKPWRLSVPPSTIWIVGSTWGPESHMMPQMISTIFQQSYNNLYNVHV